jgi:RNA polymerase sigma factor (sigma-70 family)
MVRASFTGDAARIAAGDVNGATAAALRAVSSDVLSFLSATLRDDADVSDAFSDFAERLLTGIAGFRREASLRTWAFQVARSAAIDLRRDAFRRRMRRLEASEVARLAAETRSRWAREQRAASVLDGIRATLSLEERSLLALRIDRKLSFDEISEVLSAGGDPVTARAAAARFGRLKARIVEQARALGALE